MTTIRQIPLSHCAAVLLLASFQSVAGKDVPVSKVPSPVLISVFHSKEFEENAENLEAIKAKTGFDERLDALRSEFVRAEHLNVGQKSWWLLEANQHARNSAYYLLRDGLQDYKVLGVFSGQSCILSEDRRRRVIVTVMANYGGGNLEWTNFRLQNDHFIQVSTRSERVRADQ